MSYELIFAHCERAGETLYFLTGDQRRPEEPAEVKG